MKPRNLCPEKWREAVESLQLKKKAAYDISITGTLSDQFQCKKCRMRMCSYMEAQTRSADEAMTVFVTCHNCWHRWKC
jgi:DNA-directed RNA polymerase subunit M/transcription elongation factor TFIIS